MLVQCVVVVLGEDDALFVPHPPFPPFQTGFEYYSDGEWPQACARLLLCKVNLRVCFPLCIVLLTVLLVCTYSIIDLLHDSAAPTSWMVSDY